MDLPFAWNIYYTVADVETYSLASFLPKIPINANTYFDYFKFQISFDPISANHFLPRRDNFFTQSYSHTATMILLGNANAIIKSSNSSELSNMSKT